MRLARVAEFTLGAVGFLAMAGCGGAPEQGDLDSVGSESHYYDGGGWGGTWGGGDGSTSGPRRARSYINRDTGTATENPDVNLDSSCRNPDQYDVQKLSSAGTTNRNVHNDACLYKNYYAYSTSDYADTTAVFESTGVGYISACPDPDGVGPKTARTADRNGDGKADVCFQSGYQSKGTAGDFEYHARLNNDKQPGEQKVVFCYDRNANGCVDEEVKDTIRVQWTY